MHPTRPVNNETQSKLEGGETSVSDLANEISFKAVDAFGWEIFAKKLQSFLIIERDVVSGSCVVSLSAPFGSGKTTFLQMWRKLLQQERMSAPETPIMILLNAWEDDYCGDPVLSLVSAINAEMSAFSDKKVADKLNEFKKAATDAAWFVTGLANSFVSHWSGLDPAMAGKLAEERKAAATKAEGVTDILTEFAKKKSALKSLTQSLSSLLKETGSPVFIAVDELDRCRPDFAIHYLETVKHIFDIKGLCFVLSVDVAHLENSARCLYGPNLNFEEYYRKFVHRRVTLPKPDLNGIRQLVTRYTDRYIDTRDAGPACRQTWLDLQNARKSLVELSVSSKLTPRQLDEAFRVLGHLAGSESNAKNGKLFYHVAAASIFLTFLNIKAPLQFAAFSEGVASLTDLANAVAELAPKESHKWWASTLALSFGEGFDVDLWRGALIGACIIPNEATVQEVQEELSRLAVGHGPGTSSLREIARKISEIDRFASS